MKISLPNFVAVVFFSAITNVFATGEIDPRGPVENPRMKVTADAQGVQAPGYHFQNNCAKPSPWQAHWIWLSGESRASAAMFRKEITLAEAPQAVKAWMSADMKYRLYINGRLVSRGPVDIGHDFAGGNTHRWFYDFRDLDSFFQKWNQRHRGGSIHPVADQVHRFARSAGLFVRGGNHAP